MPPTTTYSISDLAKEFDITPRSIRFYEEKGFITPTRQGTKRIFSSADRVRLKLILRGKRLGLSLEDSVSIVNLYDPIDGNQQQTTELLKQLEQRKASLIAQLNDIRETIAELDELKARLNESQGAS